MGRKDGKNPFPVPSDIGSVAGAEDWQELYPYFTRFRKEDDKLFWFYNSMHFPEPISAFDGIGAEAPYTALGAMTARVFAFPTVLGIEYRILNGRVYITSHGVTDPGRIQERLAEFQQRAGYYYQNWAQLFGEWKTRMENLIADCKAIEVPALGEFEKIGTVTSALGVAENHFVRAAWHRTVECYSKMWNHHFEFLMLGYGAYLVFFQFCKKAFPEIADQTVARMVAGIDVLMFRPDDELKRLAKAAVDLGVDGKFVEGADPADILASMQQLGEAGKSWLAELERSREPWFNISSGDGFYHHQRSWNDDLSIPFSALPRYIDLIKKGESLDRPTEKLRAERARFTAEYRELLATADDKAAFDQMLGLCHLVFPYVEDHKFYCEHWFVVTFYNKVREFGALLARQNVLENGEDIFHLQHTEVEYALVDAMLAWAAGIDCAGGQHFKPLVKKRRAIHEKLKDWNAPAALGPMPDSLEDPAVQMLWGITSESLQRWSSPVEEGHENEISGFAASPGVVEGIARVLKSASDIGQVREGDILVCPVTNPSWGPVFGKIKAAVSDIGGTMSHAAIVAREYGLPAVVGTGQATKRIVTGQKLRVDGNRGIVTILD
ncbi:MAG TPA: PEP-utilizing enzyme [Rhizomicrobium sp.]